MTRRTISRIHNLFEPLQVLSYHGRGRLMKKRGDRHTRNLYLQAFFLCGLGCLLIGTAIGIPFMNYPRWDCSFPNLRSYHVEYFDGEVSNATRSVLIEYSFPGLEAIDVREFYTNASPVIFDLQFRSESQDFDFNITYYDFSNETAEPINLDFQFVPTDIPYYYDRASVTVTIQWNNTPAYFSSWLFLRIREPPIVCVPPPDLNWYSFPPLLLFGLVFLIIGIRQWHQAVKTTQEISENWWPMK